jgi:hypothetical protein
VRRARSPPYPYLTSLLGRRSSEDLQRAYCAAAERGAPGSGAAPAGLQTLAKSRNTSLPNMAYVIDSAITTLMKKEGGRAARM